MKCSEVGCQTNTHARGLCFKHYMRLLRHGSTFKPDWNDRFWAKVERTETCWLWMGAPSRKGYAQFRTPEGKQVAVHRLAYAHIYGPIPDGMTLDHLCRVHNCVNPEHLEPVTRGENVLRGQTLAAANRAKVECPKGHPYDATNTRHWRGRRICLACRRS